MPSAGDTKMEAQLVPTVMGLAVDHSRTTQQQNAVHDTFLKPNNRSNLAWCIALHVHLY